MTLSPALDTGPELTAPDGAAPDAPASDLRVLEAGEWRALEQAHAERADELTRVWREHRERHEPHAVEDFLFTYYSVKPSVLRRWHPGPGIALADAAGTTHAGRRWHRALADGSVALDAAAFLADRGSTVAFIEGLAGRVLDRRPSFGCFGLHEWAMVYRQDEHRHPIPLRLGQAGTDEVVEANRIVCTHFDAYRFFTPEAAPLNTLRPTREAAPELEQAGCLHANMDLYKWATKLGPAVPGELVLDAFALAREIRWTDMQASPYDVSRFGVPAIRIETPEGKAEYAALQRGYAERAQAIRGRLVEAIRELRAAAERQAIAAA